MRACIHAQVTWNSACECSVSIVLGTYYFIVVRSFDLVLHDLVLLFVPQYVKGTDNRFGVNIHAMTNEWHRLQWFHTWFSFIIQDTISKQHRLQSFHNVFWVVVVTFKHKAMVGKVTLTIITEDFHPPLDLYCT